MVISAEVCNAIGDNVYTCCNSTNQCNLNQGDCDLDIDCTGNFVCGKDNCQPPFPIGADCCKLGKLTSIHIRFSI